MRVTVTTAGLDRLRAKVHKALHFLGEDGMRAVLKEEGKQLVEMYKRTIASYTPGPVQDITQETKRRKARDGFAVYPILRASGDMMNSMYHVVRHAGGAWVLALGFRGTDRRGTPNAEKAKGHIEGTAHLPRRDFTVIPKGWSKHLTSQLRRKLGWKP